MARFRAESDDDVPVQVAAYDPALHGPGDRGVDTWRWQAAEWLTANPGRSLPLGRRGDLLDVLRESCRLKMADLGVSGPWDD